MLTVDLLMRVEVVAVDSPFIVVRDPFSGECRAVGHSLAYNPRRGDWVMLDLLAKCVVGTWDDAS